jgi:hypothetical protein
MKTLLLDLVNKIKSNLKLYVIAAVIILMGLFGFKACRKVQQKQDKQASSTVLTPDQKEKIIVDPVKHTLTVVTKKSDGTTQTKTTFLPDRPTTVTEDNNGKLSIVDHKFGTEIRPYLGVGGALDGTPRVHIGADLWYFHKLDLGLGLDTNPSNLKYVRANLNLSYNFWSNTSVAISLDNHKVPGLFLKLRF